MTALRMPRLHRAGSALALPHRRRGRGVLLRGMAHALQRELRASEALNAARAALADWRRLRVGALLLSVGFGRDDGFPASAHFERVWL